MKMAKGKLILVVFMFLVFLLGIVVVSAGCSIGANPLTMNARAVPGQIVEAKWNLYNLYGDRVTHISISKSDGPDWEITYNPTLHEVRYEVSGVIETIEENFALEKKEVVLIIPGDVPEGETYLKHPNQAGYIPAKYVEIKIKVPEDTKIWRDYKFVFNANGKCFSEPGAVMPSVATQLELDVKTVSETFYEKPVEGEEEEEGAISLTRITGAVIGVGLPFQILGAMSFILIVVLLALLVKIKRVSKKGKKSKLKKKK